MAAMMKLSCETIQEYYHYVVDLIYEKLVLTMFSFLCEDVIRNHTTNLAQEYAAVDWQAERDVLIVWR